MLNERFYQTKHKRGFPLSCNKVRTPHKHICNVEVKKKTEKPIKLRKQKKKVEKTKP
jgi:hypothetical protein